jgi:hypothetical protein
MLGLKQSILMSQVTSAGEAVKLGHTLVTANWHEAKVKLVQYLCERLQVLLEGELSGRKAEW